MRILPSILALGMVWGWVGCAQAVEEDSQIFAFGKRAKVYYVVTASPIFDGTGYASQHYLRYAPYRGGLSAPDLNRNDYYRPVWELP